MQVEDIRRGRVALIRFSNPPVNAISIGSGLVAQLSDRLAQANADVTVDAIVLSGGPARFSGGADINDFADGPDSVAPLRALIEAVEQSAKPVVAAVSGQCLGGGAELALACHARIASSDARFAFPEVTLGLLPGGGGTQRLPRLCGAAAALEMMLGGKPVDAERAIAIGLIDRIANGDAEDAALAFLAEAGATRRTGTLPPPADLADAVAKAGANARTLAAKRIVDCVEAIGAGELADGLGTEAEHFGKLLTSPQSAALRHGFFGRRTAARIPGMAEIKAQPIDSITVIGGGLMGSGIALALLSAGKTVTLVEPRADALEKAKSSIAAAIRRHQSKGRIDTTTADARIAALSTAADVDGGSSADLFIEAVFEDMAVKREVFEAIDRVAGPGAILASNTSTLDLDAIAAVTSRPEQVVGLHFFSPANIMKLLEVVRGAKTSPQTLVTAMGFARAIGKSPVAAGVCDGFIGNRMFEEYLRQAWFMLEEGALPMQLDAALKGWGMAMGPVGVMDLAGQDIGWSIRKRRAIEAPDRPYSQVPDRVCELGRYGQKTGAGFYLYPDGRTAERDPEIDALIIAESDRIGLARRDIADEEIVTRCIYALINEGAKILAEGIAYRPVDIDVVWLDGYGFPAERGGPMHYADSIGLPQVLARIEALARGRHGWAWEPAPLLIELAQAGHSFASLNGR